MTEDAGIGRTPPHDLDAEKSVLGGIMITPDPAGQALAVADVQAVMSAGDFYRPGHKAIYEAITELARLGEPADPIAVGNKLTQLGEIDRVGGAPYLHECAAAIPTRASTAYYARIVAERAVLRRIVELGIRLTQIGYEGRGDIDDLVDHVRSAALEATASATDRRGALEHALDPEAMAEIFDEMEAGAEESGDRVPTGFLDLDSLLGGGFVRGQLVVVGARPAVGKSTLGLDMARGAVRAGHHAVFFGLEMGLKEMRQRYLAAESGVLFDSVRSGGDLLSEEDWRRLSQTAAQRHERNLYMADRCTTVAQIRSESRRYQARTGRLDMVVVDYLQLIPSDASAENRQQAVAEASRALKLMAKELDTVVVMLSQLNRKSEDRSDRRPMLSDLRESGAVEQDADVAILIHREDLHDKESVRAGEADFIVAKNRNGTTATITTAFRGHYAQFADMMRG